MLDPPFLELEYYVPTAQIAASIDLLLAAPRPIGASPPYAAPGIVGICDAGEEIAVLNDILIVRTEGEAFCGPERKRKKQMRRLGLRVYERFVEMAETIPCYYGAILVEYTLEKPSELRSDPRSYAFRNFYLSDRVGEPLMDKVVRILGNRSYVERRPNGLYASMFDPFNPAHVDLPPEESELISIEIGRLVGKALP